jgi:hypothetical protein
MEQLDNMQLLAGAADNGPGGGGALQKAGGFAGGKPGKAQYDNLLDFSSEIEFDERFDQHRYIADTLAVGTVRDGQHRIDRSKPENVRANTKV